MDTVSPTLVDKNVRDDYAHHHIPSFLAVPLVNTKKQAGDDDSIDDVKKSDPSTACSLTHGGSSSGRVQVVHDGSMLTAENLRNPHHPLSIDKPILITDCPASIGMTVPPSLTLDDVADRVGTAYPVHVLDVATQTELDGWTLGDLVEYFRTTSNHETNSNQSSQDHRDRCDSNGKDIPGHSHDCYPYSTLLFG